MVTPQVIRVSGVSDVGPVTGEQSRNHTGSRFGIYGTDLGILWDNGNGEVLAAFGDTYGRGWAGNGAGPATADWRCNVLAATTTTDLTGGFELYPVVTRPDGTAGEVLPRDGAAAEEATVIPTTGIAVNGTNYLHYMSVRRWGEPGHWETNYGGIAVSPDHGRSWQQPAGARWANQEQRGGLFGLGKRREHPFQMGAFVPDGEYVYLLGTPAGRFGAASLARITADRVSDVDGYEYWTGTDWQAGDPFAATPVMSGPIGEVSVRYNSFCAAWLALHLDESRAAIVLRSAPELTGPWSDPVPVVSGTNYPALYGGYLHPWSSDGPDVYFTMSQWGPYNVSLLRATLANG